MARFLPTGYRYFIIHSVYSVKRTLKNVVIFPNYTWWHKTWHLFRSKFLRSYSKQPDNSNFRVFPCVSSCCVPNFIVLRQKLFVWDHFKRTTSSAIWTVSYRNWSGTGTHHNREIPQPGGQEGRSLAVVCGRPRCLRRRLWSSFRCPDNSEEDFGIWMLRTKDHQVLKNMVKPLPHGILEVLEKGDNCTKYSLQGVPEYC